MGEQPTPQENLAYEDFSGLNFVQLEKVFRDISELAKKTWTREGDRFKNANGDGVSAEYRSGVYRPIFLSEKFPEFARHLMQNPQSILAEGSSDKEAVLQAIQEMIEVYGNRVIE